MIKKKNLSTSVECGFKKMLIRLEHAFVNWHVSGLLVLINDKKSVFLPLSSVVLKDQQ